MTTDAPTTHVIGAGLAGLSTAMRMALAGRKVTLTEAAGHAGGRCRSFHDAKLGREIDNGNHLVLSGNTAALGFLDAIGARHEVMEFAEPTFPFIDLESGERWVLHPDHGRLPRWLFDPARRVRGAGVIDHLKGAGLLFAGANQTVAGALRFNGIMAERFWEPMTLAVLNTAPEHASAQLLKRVLLETFGKGGRNARPVIARDSLGRAFVAPAIARLTERGVPIRFHSPLRALETGGARVTGLVFADRTVPVAGQDSVVLALPPSRLAALLPGLTVPSDGAVIANAHFTLADDPFAEPVALIGLTRATTHWIFRRPGLISTTISAAHDLGHADGNADALLDTIWAEVVAALDLPADTTPLARRLIREKRATFDQSPDEVAKRPHTRTPLGNLMLAGDAVNTGLPATIEGAIRSGAMAADAIVANV